MGMLAWTALRLSAVRRRCARAEVDGVPVLLSDRYGPAVLGLWRPCVVVPAWLLEVPAAERALVLRHEREHAAAGDGWLLFLSAATLAAMPWNPLLWWQHRRLRLAVEIDCDARVLAAGASRRVYGEALLRTAGSPASILTPAWGEPKSNLERRILAMTATRPRHRAFLSAIAGAAALCATLAACEVAGGPTAAPALQGREPAKRARTVLTTTVSTVRTEGAREAGTLVEQVTFVGSPARSTSQIGMSYGWDNLSLRMGPGIPYPVRMPFHPVVSKLVPGGAGERAGFAVGDSIIAVNGRDGREKQLFGGLNPGDRYPVVVSRGGVRHTLTLVPDPPLR
jgi:hypothetical protein